MQLPGFFLTLALLWTTVTWLSEISILIEKTHYEWSCFVIFISYMLVIPRGYAPFSMSSLTKDSRTENLRPQDSNYHCKSEHKNPLTLLAQTWKYLQKQQANMQLSAKESRFASKNSTVFGRQKLWSSLVAVPRVRFCTDCDWLNLHLKRWYLRHLF